MTINNWWQSSSGESYWMEITDRDDLGTSLWAPQRDGSGGDSWSYTLLTYVEPGDRVFHWHKSMAGEPAIVGWSEAAGPIRVETKSWQARGTRGRARGVPTVGPAWVVPLVGFVKLAEPITRAMINERYGEVIAVLDQASSLAGGAPYAPFQNYGGRELRAQQGYLTKFPSALVDLLFASKLGVADASTGSTSQPKTPRRGGGQGYLSDAEMRSALERHAVDLAVAHYREQGATQIEELGKPYDLRVVIGGDERHIEVKGSTGIEVGSVQLTQGEVLHAMSWAATDLVVVDSIDCWRDDSGVVRTSGGRMRVWSDWVPQQAHLVPTHLRYQLPAP